MSKHLLEQPSAKPTAKVTAAGVGAGLAAVVLGLADLANTVELPGWANAVLTGVAAFVGGYLKKSQVIDA